MYAIVQTTVPPWLNLQAPEECSCRRRQSSGKEPRMLYTVAVVLLVLWVLGLVTSYTLGGFIHVLLVVAVVAVLFNLFSGRRSP